MRCRTLFGVAITGLTLVAAAACGSDSDDATTETTTEVSGSDLTVQVVEPADGAEVGLPFTLELDVGVEIGPPDSGLHHVHLFFDGDTANFEIVDSESWEVTADSEALAGVEAGEHGLNVSLHTADHEPVGAEDQIDVTLADAGDAPSDDSGDADDSDGTDDTEDSDGLGDSYDY